MTATATRTQATRNAVAAWVEEILRNGTCTRPNVEVGQQSCIGTVLYTEHDALSIGTWEVVDHSTGDAAVYLSMPAQRYTVALVSTGRFGTTRSHSFHTDSKEAAWKYLRTVSDTLPAKRASVAWALVCSAQ